MSLLPVQIKANETTNYFATVNASGTSVARAFTATGGAGADFVAQGVQDTGAGFAPAEVFQNNANLPRWAIGVANAETGGNVGSDLVTLAYNDAGTVSTIKNYVSRQLAEAGSYGHFYARTQGATNGTVGAVDSNISCVATHNVSQPGTYGVASEILTANINATPTSPFVAFRNNVEGNTGRAEITTQDQTTAVHPSMIVSLDATLTGRPAGEVNFAVPMKVNSVFVDVPFVSRGTFADNFGGLSTVSFTLPTETFNRPYILVSVSLTTTNNDVANPASVVPSVAIAGFPAQTGNTFGTGASSYDTYANTQDYLLTFGTDYNSASTTLVVSFNVTGRIVNNSYSVKVVGHC